jgi:peptidoglycan/LPS O-acetylase OafA/YrhL
VLKIHFTETQSLKTVKPARTVFLNNTGHDVTLKFVTGLDTLRALAVTLVVLHHYTLFVSSNDDPPSAGSARSAGPASTCSSPVRLPDRQPDLRALRSAGEAGLSLKTFYARRLLRTLPNYYVVLALYALWPAFRGGASAMRRCGVT